MLIRLTKSKKGPVLTCVRRDGSETYSRSRHGDFFAYHDLTHFAVETVLGRRRSFYGLVAAGRQIPEFNVPGAMKSLGLPEEAGVTEFIVGALDAAARSGLGYDGLSEIDVGEVNAEIEQGCRNARAEPPAAITAAQLRAIAELISTLGGRWRELPIEGWMEMEYPEA